jgi:oligopeptide/dipeptide ABC transporter ATP-binding protein
MSEAVLEVKSVSAAFETPHGDVPIVEDVSLELASGEMLGIVGESGVGKTTLALAILRLLPPTARVTGEVLYRGNDLLRAREKALRAILGAEISFIPSSGRAALVPVFTVGRQLTDVIRTHQAVSSDEALDKAKEILRRVGLADPERRLGSYPHELSGGMAQRVAIAMALVNHPDVVIADEPTGGLDVTIQTQILDLMRDLNATLGHSTILISRDLGVIANYCARVAVMYRGRLVESGPLAEVYAQPGHPYTEALLDAFSLQRERIEESRHAAASTLVDPPEHGCPYQPRCAYAKDRCVTENPAATALSDVHWAKCHFARSFRG